MEKANRTDKTWSLEKSLSTYPFESAKQGKSYWLNQRRSLLFLKQSFPAHVQVPSKLVYISPRLFESKFVHLLKVCFAGNYYNTFGFPKKYSFIPLSYL